MKQRVVLVVAIAVLCLLLLTISILLGVRYHEGSGGGDSRIQRPSIQPASLVPNSPTQVTGPVLGLIHAVRNSIPLQLTLFMAGVALVCAAVFLIYWKTRHPNIIFITEDPLPQPSPPKPEPPRPVISIGYLIPMIIVVALTLAIAIGFKARNAWRAAHASKLLYNFKYVQRSGTGSAVEGGQLMAAAPAAAGDHGTGVDPEGADDDDADFGTALAVESPTTTIPDAPPQPAPSISDRDAEINGKLRSFKPARFAHYHQPSIWQVPDGWSPRIGNPWTDYERFDPNKTLGTGSFGSVVLATSRSHPHAQVAIKTVDTSKPVIREITIMEAALMEHLRDQPNIVQHLAAYEEGTQIFQVLEYMDSGNVWELWKSHGQKLPEPLLSFLARSMLTALSAVHSIGWIHRDVKPQNILLATSGTAKLADFGLSCPALADKPAEWAFAGTPLFVAPEIQDRQFHNQAADIWSLGATLWRLGGLSPDGSGASRYLQGFLRYCIVKNWRGRATADSLLSHPFITEYMHVATWQAGLNEPIK